MASVPLASVMADTAANPVLYERLKGIQKQEFPEWARMTDLLEKMWLLMQERMHLLDAKGGQTAEDSDEMIVLMQKTRRLVSEIEIFERQQNDRVKKITAGLRSAQEIIQDISEAKDLDKARIVKQGKFLPVANKHMDWEHDSEVGRPLSRDEELDQVIQEAQKQIVRLLDDLPYEAVMHGLLQNAMLTFACNVKMTGEELAQWVRSTEMGQLLTLGRRALPEAEEKLGEYFREKYRQAVALEEDEIARVAELEKQERRAEAQKQEFLGSKWGKTPCHSCGQLGHLDKNCPLSDEELEEIRATRQGRSNSSSEDQSSMFSATVTTESAISPIKENGGPDEIRELPMFCTFCEKFGHRHDLCPEMYPEEEQPDYCDRCEQFGHWEETCWVTHPELKAEYMAAKKKFRCTFCFKDGHTRNRCWILYPHYKPTYHRV